jgi:hypothetical protein
MLLSCTSTKIEVMRKKTKKSGMEDQLRKKVAASLADPRKSIAASKVFKHQRGIHSAAIRNASSRGASAASLEGWPRIVAHPSRRGEEGAPQDNEAVRRALITQLSRKSAKTRCAG